MKYLDRPLGIDLGTTNSAVSLLEPGGRELLLFEDRFRRKVVPSVVGWDPAAEEVLVGFPAWNRRGLTPAPVQSIKRKMGQEATVEIGPHSWTPQEVSARILRELPARMLEFASPKLEGYELRLGRAVITVPAYFDAPQIEATRKAGELAGLEVLGLLQEPTAAAMHHAWSSGRGDATYLVYDLGGGTFDVSVIRCLMGEYQVLGIHGDNYLGGDDFDRRFADHLRRQLVSDGYALDLDIANNADDATRFQILVRVAQEVKEALSTSTFQYVGRRDLFEDQDGNPVTLEMEVSRGEFEGLIRSYVEQTISCCTEALALAMKAANVGLGDIDVVLLVGGSTRVPLVQQLVADAFCGPGKSKADSPTLDEPDTCVALGAAIHAANLGGLTLGDDEAELSVCLTSPLTTRKAKARLVGRVDGAAGSATLSDITDPENPEVIGEAEVKDSRFRFTDIDLPDEGLHLFSLAVGGTSFPIGMYRGGDVRSTGSALSNPTVLAKDIYLEVVKLGKPGRAMLVEKGTSLPAEVRHRFYTADQSGAVILRLLQNRMPIRTIHLEVPRELPLHTPVDVKISVDDSLTMVAEGAIADQVFWANIEPPGAAAQKSWEEVEAVLERADQVAAGLWGGEAAWVREKVEYLKAGIREAARTDPDKLQVLVSRLEDLLEDFSAQGHELSPTYDRFEWRLNQIRRRVFRDPGERCLGLDADGWTARLAELESRGGQAYERADVAGWRRAYSQAQAIVESLNQEDASYSDPEDPETLRRRFRLAHSVARDLQENLAILTLSENEETRAIQQAEKLAILDALNSEVLGPLEQIDPDVGGAAMRTALEKVHGALRRLEKRLERLPSIGLVTS
jgi:molecular chaperone DnaK